MLTGSNEASNITNSSASSESQSLTFKNWKALKDSQNKTNVESQIRRNAHFKGMNNNNFFVLRNRNDGPNNNSLDNFISSRNNVNRPNYSFSNLRNSFNTIEVSNFTNANKVDDSRKYNNFIPLDNYFTSDGLYEYMAQESFLFANRHPHEMKVVQSFDKLHRNKLGLNNFDEHNRFHHDDMMQKPLLSNNPFRNEQRTAQLLQKFKKPCFTTVGNKKKRNDKPDTSIQSTSKFNEQCIEEKFIHCTESEDYVTNANTCKAIDRTSFIINQNVLKPNLQLNKVDKEDRRKEPLIYVSNPKAKFDGKQYIPKPKPPEENLEITKEEKRKQWKEYREAMKPFKNREFYNAKRVLQRLGKKAPSELEERQTIRLKNAKEIVDAHKARLATKHANYVKDNSNSTDLGELYVLQK